MNSTTSAALAGAADNGLFLATRPHLFRTAPQRAAGGLGFTALWLALAESARRDGTHASGRTLALSAVVAAGNAAMLAIHLRARIANPRVFGGSALAAVALVGTLRRR